MLSSTCILEVYTTISHLSDCLVEDKTMFMPISVMDLSVYELSKVHIRAI